MDRNHKKLSDGTFWLRRKINRRGFLEGLAGSAAGVVLAGCAPETETPAAPTPVLTPAPTVRPHGTLKSVGGLHQVAIARAKTYDRDVIKKTVLAMLDDLGGLQDIVKTGSKVGIKMNLTGGRTSAPPAGILEIESYMTHPEIVRALGEAILDAGASQIYFMEALFSDDSWIVYGYEDIARGLGAQLIDLNLPDPYRDFVNIPVGEGWYIYETYKLNGLLQEIDAFFSIAKMKCHYSAGVTHSMKNLIGITPVQFYRINSYDNWRSGLHGGENEVGSRLPRVIVDLNRARPIDFAFIDGIKTAEGGEVPRGNFKPVEPGLLIAGKNSVATDSVATILQGFDPTANPPNAPFLRSDNHLALATEKGLGSNLISEIEVKGESIEDNVFPFKSAVSQ